MIRINYSRIISNFLFYILYVLLASIIVSFLIPLVFVIIWKSILAPNNPVFDLIQVAIILFVLIFSLVKRKYFYFPAITIVEQEEELEQKELLTEENLPVTIDTPLIKEEQNKDSKIKYIIKTEILQKKEEKPKIEIIKPTLDIKIWKEII